MMRTACDFNFRSTIFCFKTNLLPRV